MSKRKETELSPGYEAHLKRFGPGSSPEEFEAYMFARKNPNVFLKVVVRDRVDVGHVVRWATWDGEHVDTVSVRWENAKTC